MLNALKNSTHFRSTLIAGLGAGLSYVAAAITTGSVSGGVGMLLTAAFSVTVNAIWQNLKSPDQPTPTPPAPATTA
jgi:hypothetical protein